MADIFVRRRLHEETPPTTLHRFLSCWLFVGSAKHRHAIFFWLLTSRSRVYSFSRADARLFSRSSSCVRRLQASQHFIRGVLLFSGQQHSDYCALLCAELLVFCGRCYDTVKAIFLATFCAKPCAYFAWQSACSRTLQASTSELASVVTDALPVQGGVGALSPCPLICAQRLAASLV